jgi:hypothetical protein
MFKWIRCWRNGLGSEVASNGSCHEAIGHKACNKVLQLTRRL